MLWRTWIAAQKGSHLAYPEVTSGTEKRQKQDATIQVSPNDFAELGAIE
jgi:hypothetical protein